MKKLLRKMIFGDIPVSEYSTITLKSEIKEKVWLETGGIKKDISATHWLLCLDPLVFGIWFSKREPGFAIEKEGSFRMHFNDTEKNAATVAILDMSYFDSIEEEDGTLVLLKLSTARIHHINFIKTLLLFYRHYKKPEQDFNKLRSFASAYSYPRKVRLVSFKEEEYNNIFPMDLVGDIPGSRRYVFGLRHTNVTLARIIQAKKMVVSEVPFEYKDIIYSLGKHHSSAFIPAEQSFKLLESERFGFPVPAFANSYKEISIQRTLDLGSHMLLWGEEINEKQLSVPTGHLFHIHFLHYLHQRNKGQAYPLV